MEKRAKYAKIHPEMSNLDLTKILSKKYKELPDKKKVKTRTRNQEVEPEPEPAHMVPMSLLCFSKSTSQSSSGRRRSLRRTWPGSGEFRPVVPVPLFRSSGSSPVLMHNVPQGGASGPDGGEEEVGPAGETQDAPAAVVQPREEGLHEAAPRGTGPVLPPARPAPSTDRNRVSSGESEGAEGGAEEAVVPAVRQAQAEVDQQGAGAAEGL